MLKYIDYVSNLAIKPLTSSEFSTLKRLYNNSECSPKSPQFGLIEHINNQINNDGAISYSSKQEAKIFGLLIRNQGAILHSGPMPKHPKYYQFETLASCNAGCSFCPYTTMARKGTKMSDETIDYLIRQISKRDPEDSFSVCTHKVSEPLLDKRILSIIKKVLDSHPGAKFGITSNLNYVPERFWDNLLHLFKNHGPRISLSISLNDSDELRYRDLMKMDQKKTLANLDKLHSCAHEFMAAGLKKIELTRASTNGMHDYEFVKFVEKRYPLFTPELFKISSWVEKDNDLMSTFRSSLYGDFSCKEWGRLSINAEGNASLCCMDSESVKSLGNIYSNSLEEIYNLKIQQFVPSTKKRKDSVSPCASCNYPSILK